MTDLYGEMGLEETSLHGRTSLDETSLYGTMSLDGTNLDTTGVLLKLTIKLQLYLNKINNNNITNTISILNF